MHLFNADDIQQVAQAASASASYEQVDLAVFDQVEADFAEVLLDVTGDKSLEQFKTEYEKLTRALRKSHENQRRLIRKCRELNSQVVANASKVQMALKMSQDDHASIQSLRREIERSWKMVEASHEKEQREKERITQLRAECEKLRVMIDEGQGMAEEETTVMDLKRERDQLCIGLSVNIALSTNCLV